MNNGAYVDKVIQTIREIRHIGKWEDDIVVLPDKESSSNLERYCQELNFQIKLFEPIDLSRILQSIREHPFATTIDNRELTKTFQWHKLHIFDVFFKQWDMVFYVDAGMKIMNDLSVFTKIFCEYQNTGRPVFLAHSDAYPSFEWKLHVQFEKVSNPILYEKLASEFNLNCDYFQSGMIMFESALITERTKQELLDLANMYPISKTNEQGIMNLYFTCIQNIWKALPVKYGDLFTYDYWNREGYTLHDYCMTKYSRC